MTPERQGLSRADRRQPLVLITSIGAGLLLAKIAPGIASRLSVLVNLGVFLLIALVMLGLDLHQMGGALRHRRFLAIAVVLNFMVNPALAWALGETMLANHAELRVGLILFLVTPCIGWYLIFTELAGGDTALGVGLLGINLVLQILLLPLYLAPVGGEEIAIDIGDLITSVGVFLVAPAGLAAAARSMVAHAGSDMSHVQAAVGRLHLKTGALVVVIVSMFASQAPMLFDNPTVVMSVLPAMVSFFVIAFGTSLAAGRCLGLPYEQTALLAFTTTSRNSEASLAIAATAFASPLVALVVVIGPVVELPLLVLMVRVLRTQRELVLAR